MISGRLTLSGFALRLRSTASSASVRRNSAKHHEAARVSGALFALVVAASSACYCGPVYAQTPLTISYQPAIGSAHLFVAQKEGFFKKHDIDVKLQPGGSNQEIASVVAGSANVGTPTMVQALQAIENGLNLIVVSGANPLKGGAAGLAFGPVVARKGVTIANVGDFAGKKIGVNSLYGFLHILFVKMLTDNGVDPKSVSFVEVQLPQMADALRSGTIDAVIPVEPITSRILGANVGHVVGDIAKNAPEGLPLLVHVMRADWAAKNRPVVEKFRAALAEASDFAAKNPEKVRAYAAEVLKLPPQLLVKVPVPVFEPNIEPAAAAQWVPILKQQQQLKTDLDMGKILWR